MFQDYVPDLFLASGIVFVQYASKRYQYERGENSAGIEIEFDDRLDQTANLYIEIAEKSDPGKLISFHLEFTEWIILGSMRSAITQECTSSHS